jgi:FAD-dependent oxidoreductase domain-containing protein 1
MHRILVRNISTRTDRKIVIAGGGPVGMAAAVHLARLGLGKDVVVIERDSSYKKNSAMLSAGGIRQQFSLKENIELCMYSHKFLLDLDKQAQEDPDKCAVQYRPNGYFFMASTEAGKDILAANVRMQHACGAKWIQHTEDVDLLAKTFPWLQTQGLLAGAFSKDGGEGYFDPWGLVHAMKKEAVAAGVTVINGLVVGAHTVSTHSRTGSATASAPTNGAASSGKAGQYAIDTVRVSLENGTTQDVRVSSLVNAAGAYAGKLTSLIADTIPDDNARQRALRIPVKPRKRCIFAVHCPGNGSFSHPAPTSAAPLTVDPSGVYFRGEGSNVRAGNFICGVSPSADADPDFSDDSALDIVDHHLFEEIIWPTLAERVPAFNELKVTNSWAGFYDYNVLDQNAIIGFNPDVQNVLHCNGFSGHGLQMSPAVGRAAAELLTTGRSTSIDLSRFGLERIATQTPYYETGIV